jgi:hypothetical protein
MTRNSILLQGELPLLIISSSEGSLGDKIQSMSRENNKSTLPSYLEPIERVKVKDPQSNENILSWVFRKLEQEEIPYISKKLEIADYIVKNKNTENITVIKRMSVQTIVEMWANKQKGSYYQGKRGFITMMKDLRNNFSSNVQVVLAIEDFYATIFDNTRNCIWSSWKFNESNKTDARGKPIYNVVNFKRHSIHPYTFNEVIKDLERKYNIIVKRFFNGEGLYSYIVNDLIFNRDANQDEERILYDHDEKIDALLDVIPFIERELAKSLLDQYGSVYETITALLVSIDPNQIFHETHDKDKFISWKKQMLE